MTIGQTIDKLAKKHGKDTLGIYILEQALLKVCGIENGTVKLTDYAARVYNQHISENQHYQELRRAENVVHTRVSASLICGNIFEFPNNNRYFTAKKSACDTVNFLLS